MPQCSIFDPTLFLLYTYNLLDDGSNTIVIYADDTTPNSRLGWPLSWLSNFNLKTLGRKWLAGKTSFLIVQINRVLFIYETEIVFLFYSVRYFFCFSFLSLCSLLDVVSLSLWWCKASSFKYKTFYSLIVHISFCWKKGINTQIL